MDDTELFEAALDRPTSEWEAFVRERCDDPKRTKRLLALLRVAADNEPVETGVADAVQPEARLSVGTCIGRYRVVEFIGRGASGEVYKAHDEELGRFLAVKVQRRTEGASSPEARRFDQEGKALGRIVHPNVVRVYDVGFVEERPYLVMELVEGRSLRSWIAEDGRSWRESLDVLLQAGRGLVAVHEAGLVHRDFKPDNILLDEGGRVLVSDFGIAREFVMPASQGERPGVSQSPSSSTNSAAGTPMYMAPEQWEGAVTPRSDQFAFCRVVVEALGASGATHAAGTTSPRLRPTDLEPADIAAPRWLRAVLERGLQEDPAQRYPDMAALLAALERGLARRRRIGLAALVAVGAIVATFVPRPGDSTCDAFAADRVSAEFEHRWNRLASALGGEHAPRLELIRGVMGRRLGEWSRARSELCQQHREGMVDTETAGLRSRCFTRWRGDLEHRIEWLAENVDAVASVQLAESMPRNPTRCAYVEPPGVTQPELREAEFARIEEATRAADDKRISGAYDDAQAVLKEALEVVATRGHSAYEAELLNRMGIFAARRHHWDEAEALSRRALELAERSGQAEIAVAASTALASAFLLKPEPGLRLAETYTGLARAKLERSGERRDELLAELLVAEGSLAYLRGDLVEAEARYRDASILFTELNGPQDFRVAAADTNAARVMSSLERHDDALELAVDALARRRAVIGVVHPLIASDEFQTGLLFSRAAAAGCGDDSRQTHRASARALR